MEVRRRERGEGGVAQTAQKTNGGEGESSEKQRWRQSEYLPLLAGGVSVGEK